MKREIVDLNRQQKTLEEKKKELENQTQNFASIKSFNTNMNIPFKMSISIFLIEIRYKRYKKELEDDVRN